MKALALSLLALSLAGCVTEGPKSQDESIAQAMDRKKSGPLQNRAEMRRKVLTGKIYRQRGSERSPLGNSRLELVHDGKVLAKGVSKEDGSYSLAAPMAKESIYRLRVSAVCGGNIIKDLPFRATTDKMEYDVRFDCP